ncbi:MAG: hypothetical protein VR66_23680 [Peptococcaceae bacterium BRH_c23]|nr:enoyl-CoA hydratase [Desulfosporosinus sp. BICA1-9]KJS46744.1 MAG: hypothetical protein VR66_23680 [Peptococcaceae bacterium BRH_c23]
MNIPESLNALNINMREEMLEALLAAEKDDEVRVVVITGRGRAFCSGGDIKAMNKEFTPAEGRARMQKVGRLIKCINGMNKLVIAAVNGPAIGAGCNLALACDFIIAAEEATFGQPFGRLGLVPDLGGLYYLPRRVGLAKAKELIFTWQIIDAREAERIGLVNWVVPLSDLDTEVKKLAEKLVKGPALANGLAKGIINRSLESTLDQILEEEAYAQGLCFMSQDFQEGVRAFLEKRKPNFGQ